MIKTLMIIGLGGFIGTVARYLVQLLTQKYLPLNFPLGTLIVNVTGCLLIGIIVTLMAKENLLQSDLRLFLITGICGGYTTFSAFAYENVVMLHEGYYLFFVLYTTASVVAGLMATVGGIWIINTLFP